MPTPAKTLPAKSVNTSSPTSASGRIKQLIKLLPALTARPESIAYKEQVNDVTGVDARGWHGVMA